jgi:PAS domain S-box-containing protein
MRALILSHFNQVLGPVIFLTAPKSFQMENKEQISSLMDFYTEGFFVHMSGNVKSANLIFEIPSGKARGYKESLQISIVVNIDSKINLNLVKELLETFAEELVQIEDAFKAFHITPASDIKDRGKLEEVKHYFYTYYKSVEPAIKALKEAEIRYQSLFKSARDAIIIVDEGNGRILDINAQTEQILEIQREDLIGKRVSYIPFNDDYKEVIKQITHLIQTEEATPIELRIKSFKGKDIPVEANASRIEVGDRVLIQTIFRDITERKLQEQKIIESEKEIKKKFNQLSSLFEITKLIEKQAITFQQIIQNTVDMIPMALQFPDLSCARVIFDDNTYSTRNFKETEWKISTHVKINEKLLDVEAFYFKVYQFTEEDLLLLYDIASRLKSILEQKEYEEMIKNRLNFEKIISTISSRFVNVKNYDDAINSSLRNIGQLSGASRAYLYILEDENKIMKNTHEWCAEGVKPEINNRQAIETNNISYWIERLNEGDLIKVSDISELPNEASNIRDFFKTQNIKSILAFPIKVGEVLAGLVGFDNILNASEWRDVDIVLLRIFSEILGNALERKWSQEDLRESEKRYRQLIEGSLEGVWVIDSNANTIMANPSMAKILGYNIEEIIGKSLFTFMDGKNIEKMKQRLETRKKGIGEEYEFEFLRSDGSKVQTVLKASPILSEDGVFQGSVAFITDVTEKKRAEQMLIQSKKMYHQAYDRANFYRNLFAHDMTNILNNIKSSAGLIDLFLIDPHANINKSETLKILSEQVIRGSKLISTVQKLSKVEEGNISIDIIKANDVLEKAIKGIRKIFQDRDILIDVDAISKEYFVQANELLLDVFENILTNAVRYNDNPKVSIQIKVSEVMREDGEFMKFEFLDNGIGVSDEKKEMIFQKGHMEFKGGVGMGLGLLLVNSIIKSYNGYIWVEDRVKGSYSQGSNFVILIPSVKPKIIQSF